MIWQDDLVTVLHEEHLSWPEIAQWAKGARREYREVRDWVQNQIRDGRAVLDRGGGE